MADVTTTIAAPRTLKQCIWCKRSQPACVERKGARLVLRTASVAGVIAAHFSLIIS